MAEFKKWQDMFQFNSNLMEDDWNDGQLYTIKHKQKDQGGNQFSHTAKWGSYDKVSGKQSAHKVALEHKGALQMDFANGMDFEWKIKNNGEVFLEGWWNALKEYEGFDGVNIIGKGNYQANATAPMFGIGVKKEKFKGDFYFDCFSGTYAYHSCGAARVTDWMTFGWSEDIKSIMNPLADITWSVGTASKCGDTGVQFGTKVDGFCPSLTEWQLKKCSLFFNHKNASCFPNGCVVGSQMDYDVESKKFDCKMGLQLGMDDHTWKFRLHDTGMARLALQWKLHQACKVTLNTSVDIKEAINGQHFKELPIGATFEIQY